MDYLIIPISCIIASLFITFLFQTLSNKCYMLICLLLVLAHNLQPCSTTFIHPVLLVSQPPRSFNSHLPQIVLHNVRLFAFWRSFHSSSYRFLLFCALPTSSHPCWNMSWPKILYLFTKLMLASSHKSVIHGPILFIFNGRKLIRWLLPFGGKISS